jgi:hypothetical protein
MDPTDLRMECLRLAAREGERRENIVAMAEAFFAFVVCAEPAPGPAANGSGAASPPPSDE